jgi:hypothetical protein
MSSKANQNIKQVQGKTMLQWQIAFMPRYSTLGDELKG